MAAISITIGDPAELALVLENGDETRYPQVNIYEPGNSTPVATLDLDHTAEGMYRNTWTPGSVGHYHCVYTVYDDVAHTIKNADFSRELDHILVQQDIAAIINDIHNKVIEILNLQENNVFIDLTEYDECCQVVTSRVRVFDSAANANMATDGGNETTGLVAMYQITVDYEGAAKMKTYKKVRLV